MDGEESKAVVFVKPAALQYPGGGPRGGDEKGEIRGGG